jgi:predicted MFS family arabinose efflux permease
MFYLMAVLGVGAILLALFVVPQQDKSNTPFTAKFSDVFFNADLLRLNFGVFALHAAQIALFLTLPRLLVKADLPLVSHWHLYLPAVLISFACMAPIIMMSERRKRMKPAFIFGILAMIVAQLMIASFDTLPAIATAVLIYFIGFNILEATQPSLVSRIAPASSRGAAMGVYNTAQSLGIFVGGAMGGYLSDRFGFSSVFIFCSVMMLLWLLLAYSMQAPPALKTKMYSLDEASAELSAEQASKLKNQLSKLAGVLEAVVLPQERTVILKVDLKIHNTQAWNESKVQQLLRG